jgi:peptidoglycan/LPS O-acetylase OafA/YrhL
MTRRILGFDGIRGLAVLSVVLTHLHVWKYLQDNGWLSAAFSPMVRGVTAVQAFFVLSGFLITSLLISEFERAGSISIKRFFIRRSLRIVPLYAVFLLWAVLVFALDSRATTVRSLLFAGAYVYNFVPRADETPFMGHTWSLAVEEHFYLAWPLVFICLFPKRRTQLLALLVGSVIVSPILHFVLIKRGLAGVYFVDRWTFVAGYNICLGCVLALLLLSGPSRSRAVGFVGGRWGLACAGLLFALPSMLFGLSWTLDAIVAGYCRSLGLTCAIGWLYVNQASLAARLLEWRPLRYLGAISYGVYMLQGLFLATGPEREAGHLWPPDQGVGLVWLIVLAPLSYHFFERPILALKHRWDGVRAASRGAEQPVLRDRARGA